MLHFNVNNLYCFMSYVLSIRFDLIVEIKNTKKYKIYIMNALECRCLKFKSFF